MLLKPHLALFNRARLSLNLPLVNQDALSGNFQPYVTEMIDAAVASVTANQGALPLTPSMERHPYKNSFPITPEFATYMIGTFPPINYLIDLLAFPQIQKLTKPGGKKISKPKIPIYHGQTCELWKLLGLINGRETLSENDRLLLSNNVYSWLRSNHINYFDIIDYCQRAVYDSSDSNLMNIIPNTDAFNSVLNPNVSNITLIFNTSSAFGIHGLQFDRAGNFKPDSKSFDMFIWLAITLGHEVAFSLDQNNWIEMSRQNAATLNNVFRRKLIFHLMINSKEFTVIAGVSPSKAARTYTSHPSYNHYSLQGNTPGLLNFKKFVYTKAIAREYADLFRLNS